MMWLFSLSTVIAHGSWKFPKRKNAISLKMLEKAMAPHSSTLAWKIPWMEEPGGLQSMGSLRVGHNWATSLSLFHFHASEKETATHSCVLAWRIPGTGEPGGLTSMGSHRVGHDWSDLAAAAAGQLNLLTFHLWITIGYCNTTDRRECTGGGNNDNNERIKFWVIESRWHSVLYE